MQRICVYAGSSSGVRPVYREAAQALGSALVSRGLGLVYGGGRAGLMGVIADAVLAAGGEVIGIMPRALFPQEIAHPGITTLHEVATMHERKALMADLADGFVALPGGSGTYDELFEILTWAQLGIHQKPIGLLNVSGYFDPLLALLQHTTNEGFLASQHLKLLLQHQEAAALLDRLAAYVPSPPHSKWTDLPAR